MSKRRHRCQLLVLLGLAIVAAPVPAMTLADIAATRSAARQGSAAAQLLLGMAYLRGDAAGNGTAAEGIRWLERSALQGNAYAARQLGEEYAAGRHAARNELLSGDWYERAARRGDRVAQARLGAIYLRNNDGAERARAARCWLTRAAAAGDPEAEAALAAAFPETAARASGGLHRIWSALDAATATTHTGDRPLATGALEQLARDGDVEAQLRLASDYLDGHGGHSRDGAEALRWLTRAADGGSGSAMASLAELYRRGSAGIPADPRAATWWQARAAVAGE